MQKEDRFDSYVLSETFKYLYLLFSEDKDLLIDIDSFVFTTEGHLLPLSLARLSPSTAVPVNFHHYFWLRPVRPLQAKISIPYGRIF